MNDLKDAIEAAIAKATSRLSEEDKAKLADSIKRSAVHVEAGNLSLLKTEANTVSLILWTDANERGKQARQEIINTVSGAIVKGLITAL